MATYPGLPYRHMPHRTRPLQSHSRLFQDKVLSQAIALSYRIRNHDRCQAGATFECAIFNCCCTFGNYSNTIFYFLFCHNRYFLILLIVIILFRIFIILHQISSSSSYKLHSCSKLPDSLSHSVSSIALPS